MIYQPIQPEPDNDYYHFLVMWSWVRVSPDISMLQQRAFWDELGILERGDAGLARGIDNVIKVMRDIRPDA